jgi:hypothetical protein
MQELPTENNKKSPNRDLCLRGFCSKHYQTVTIVKSRSRLLQQYRFTMKYIIPRFHSVEVNAGR